MVTIDPQNAVELASNFIRGHPEKPKDWLLKEVKQRYGIDMTEIRVESILSQIPREVTDIAINETGEDVDVAKEIQSHMMKILRDEANNPFARISAAKAALDAVKGKREIAGINSRSGNITYQFVIEGIDDRSKKDTTT